MTLMSSEKAWIHFFFPNPAISKIVQQTELFSFGGQFAKEKILNSKLGVEVS